MCSEKIPNHCVKVWEYSGYTLDIILGNYCAAAFFHMILNEQIKQKGISMYIFYLFNIGRNQGQNWKISEIEKGPTASWIRTL